MTSQQQLERLLKLVPYLQQHPGISLETAATHFGVSARTLLGDLEVLQYCGLPGGLYGDLFEVDLEGAREDGHVFFRNADVLSRPMRMQFREAAALLLALQAVVAASGGSPAADSALSKLRDVLGGIDPAATLELAEGKPAHRRQLETAIQSRRVVKLHYLGPAGPSAPEVEPARIDSRNGVLYLEAWARERSAWRTYRIERIEQVQLCEETFELRSGLAAHREEWFAETTKEMELVVSSQGAWIADHYPIRERAQAPEGLRIRLPLVSREWAAALLLRLGTSVVSVDDEQVAAEAAQQATAALSHYR